MNVPAAVDYVLDQLRKPPVGLSLFFAFCGNLVLFFLSALGYSLYVDHQRKLFGSALVGAGLLLALSSWGFWFFGW